MARAYIDMHCDTLLKEIEGGRLYDNPENMLDIRRMAAGGPCAQFFAVFFPPRIPEDVAAKTGIPLPPPYTDDELFEKARALLMSEIARHPDVIRLALSAEDIERNLKEGLCSAVLTIEDGRAVAGDMEKLRAFYDAGVRAMALTWNHPNCFGHPNSQDPEKMTLGLTEFGKEAVSEFNRLGMLIDVSHLSDGGFWDVAALSDKPFIASHSNCRALCNHPRNLTDGMIRALADKGGVIGVNFAPDFLTDDGSRQSRLEDICRHVLHMVRIGGEDCAALGTDFDGIMGAFEIGSPAEMYRLFDALGAHGLTERQIGKFARENVLRVMRDAL
jgi:membrane dipeptidase